MAQNGLMLALLLVAAAGTIHISPADCQSNDTSTTTTTTTTTITATNDGGLVNHTSTAEAMEVPSAMPEAARQLQQDPMMSLESQVVTDVGNEEPAAPVDIKPVIMFAIAHDLPSKNANHSWSSSTSTAVSLPEEPPSPPPQPVARVVPQPPQPSFKLGKRLFRKKVTTLALAKQPTSAESWNGASLPVYRIESKSPYWPKATPMTAPINQWLVKKNVTSAAVANLRERWSTNRRRSDSGPAGLMMGPLLTGNKPVSRWWNRYLATGSEQTPSAYESNFKQLMQLIPAASSVPEPTVAAAMWPQRQRQADLRTSSYYQRPSSASALMATNRKLASWRSAPPSPYSYYAYHHHNHNPSSHHHHHHHHHHQARNPRFESTIINQQEAANGTTDLSSSSNSLANSPSPSSASLVWPLQHRQRSVTTDHYGVTDQELVHSDSVRFNRISASRSTNPGGGPVIKFSVRDGDWNQQQQQPQPSESRSYGAAFALLDMPRTDPDYSNNNNNKITSLIKPRSLWRSAPGAGAGDDSNNNVERKFDLSDIFCKTKFKPMINPPSAVLDISRNGRQLKRSSSKNEEQKVESEMKTVRFVNSEWTPLAPPKFRYTRRLGVHSPSPSVVVNKNETTARQANDTTTPTVIRAKRQTTFEPSKLQDILNQLPPGAQIKQIDPATTELLLRLLRNSTASDDLERKKITRIYYVHLAPSGQSQPEVPQSQSFNDNNNNRLGSLTGLNWEQPNTNRRKPPAQPPTPQRRLPAATTTTTTTTTTPAPPPTTEAMAVKFVLSENDYEYGELLCEGRFSGGVPDLRNDCRLYFECNPATIDTFACPEAQRYDIGRQRCVPEREAYCPQLSNPSYHQ